MKTTQDIPTQPRGQALAELAIVLPLLVILLLGVVDFSRLYYHFQAVESAARAGAQYGCLNKGRAADTNRITQAALGQACDITNRSPVVVSAVVNNVLNVTVGARFNTLVPWPGVPNKVNVVRTVRMRVLK